MNDELINQLAVQVAQLRNEIDELRSQIEESSGDSMDDLFLRIGDTAPGGDGSAASYGTFRVEMTDEVDEVSGNTKYKITNCRFYAKHSVVSLSDVIGSADGTWYLNVPHSNPSNASLSTSSGNNDDNNTSIPLFTIADGEVAQDWRGMPFIPIYA